MKTVNTSELSGRALDYAVALAMGMQVEIGAECCLSGDAECWNTRGWHEIKLKVE